MRKLLKWLGIAVLTPVLLFIILAAMLYLPPIQNWVAQKVTAIASEQTGMEISVGHVSLEWPLDLSIDDFRMLHPNDIPEQSSPAPAMLACYQRDARTRSLSV